jgi:predicted RNA binding protein with dsRBD fold (UPF0201 family)
MEFTWKIYKVIAKGENIVGVYFGLSATDGKNTVSMEGEHTFKDGTVNIAYKDIKEYNLINWLSSETDEQNLLKPNLEKQLNSLKNPINNDMPWLADTFTPGN